MATALVFHDMPVADAIRNQTLSLTVIEVETETAVHDRLDEADIFVTNPTKWSDSFIDHLNKGDWIQATSVGYASFPVSEFRKRSVTLTNAATVHDSVVSEHAFALSLALSRNIGTILAQQRDHEWNREVSTDMWDWKGQQLTVFGLGNIGEAVARRGQAFGLEVQGVKRTPSTYTGTLSRTSVFSTDDFHKLLPNTDLLILTVPLTDATHHVINEDVLNELSDSAVLVNVARGAVVDHNALIQALQDGKLDGAALDVCESEPLPSNSPLWDHDDVIITPHVGGRSKHFPDRFAQLFVDNYKRWRTSQPLVNRVV